MKVSSQAPGNKRWKGGAQKRRIYARNDGEKPHTGMSEHVERKEKKKKRETSFNIHNPNFGCSSQIKEYKKEKNYARETKKLIKKDS